MIASLTLALLMAPPVVGFAAFPQTAPLQPWSDQSSSGTWRLEVDPTERLGAGPGRHRVLRAGELVWSKRLPFTLHGGLIDDLGFVVGYGYDEGWNGVAPSGAFFVATLSPEGAVLARHEWPMISGYGIHSAPDPRVAGLVHDALRRRVVVLR